MLLDYEKYNEIFMKYKDKFKFYDQDDYQVWTYIPGKELYANISRYEHDVNNTWKWSDFKETLIANFHENEDEVYRPSTDKKQIQVFIITEIIKNTNTLHYYGFPVDKENIYGHDVAGITFRSYDEIKVKEINTIEEFENYLLER